MKSAAPTAHVCVFDERYTIPNDLDPHARRFSASEYVACLRPATHELVLMDEETEDTMPALWEDYDPAIDDYDADETRSSDTRDHLPGDDDDALGPDEYDGRDY